MGNNTGPQDASGGMLFRLREAQTRDSRYLNLSRSNLTSVPKEVFAMGHLETIDLSFNEISTIPKQLFELPRLKKVNLCKNPIETLSHHRRGVLLMVDADAYHKFRSKLIVEFVTVMVDLHTSREASIFLVSDRKSAQNLSGLTIFQDDQALACPAVVRVLNGLDRFLSLEELCILGVRMRTLSPGVRHLKKLRVLELNGLQLDFLPIWLRELRLEIFSAFNNRLTSFPDLSGSIDSLQYLNLSRNLLHEIPAWVFNSKSLKSLKFGLSSIESIPSEILQLDQLDDLECLPNPLKSPPVDVAVKGLGAIRDYWRQRNETGVDYLCEAKLIILGEGGAGKTSLARKIKKPEYKLNTNEKSTEGIDVIRFHFPTTIRVREGGERVRSLQRDFQVNIWDFGGQEIYHATHQFFLTKRSVYLLVCDDRKEDTDFSYWLQVVEMLSDGSPLLIVQNEKQGRSRDINVGALRGRFPNLRGSHSTNLDSNQGLDTVIRAIQKELENLPHVGVGLPSTWKRVREVLEKDRRDHISLREYLDICKNNGFSRHEDKLQLSGYLHDLGICLHFQEDSVLKNTIILKPSWGTDAVYRVLDDTEIINSYGHFNRNDLKRVWSEARYEGMQDELLRLMMKFQLCYELENERALIAPQLLSFEQPLYQWDSVGGVIVRYEYEFLPKGILTRFIVALHHLISKGNVVWKTGVVLERDGSKAEIVEDYAQRRIQVRVQGPSSYGLLAIVDDHLERLHASFPRLQYERYLPCSCKECKMKAESRGFALKALLSMIGKNQQIQCHDSGEMVDAARLVWEILPGVIAEKGGNAIGYHQQTLPAVAATSPIPTFEVFVSYAWNEESNRIVDYLHEVLGKDGIHLIRDKEEVRYKDSIRSFMERIGKGKCVVVIISEKYLKSENCMFEMLAIARAQHLRDRIFPIVLSDANVYKATGRVRYVQHWEREVKELDEALKTVRGDNLAKLQEDLTIYSEIRRQFDSIAYTLRDMNALTPEIHEHSNFEELIRRIRTQL